MNKSYILVLGMFFVLISCKKDVYISYNETLINIYDKKTKESYSSLENYKKAKELETSHIKELTIEIYNQSKNLLIKNKSFFHFLDKKNEVSQDNTIVAVENGHKWIQKNNKFLVGLNAGVKNQRIYSFESDLLYSFFIPFFQDEGFRYYLNLRYNWNYHLSTEFRIARTDFFDIDEIGSGNNLISGNSRTDVKVQVRYRF